MHFDLIILNPLSLSNHPPGFFIKTPLIHLVVARLDILVVTIKDHGSVMVVIAMLRLAVSEVNSVSMLNFQG